MTGIELIEYQTVKRHHEMAQNAVVAGVWNETTDTFAELIKKWPTFSEYMATQSRNRHSKFYMTKWLGDGPDGDDRIRRLWEKRHVNLAVDPESENEARLLPEEIKWSLHHINPLYKPPPR